MGYFRNQIIDKDNKGSRQAQMQSDMLDGFLNQAEFEEIKRNYDDFNLGDVVIEFPNPDNKNACPNKDITYK